MLMLFRDKTSTNNNMLAINNNNNSNNNYNNDLVPQLLIKEHVKFICACNPFFKHRMGTTVVPDVENH